MGLVCLGFAFFAGSIEGTVIEVINKISSVFYGPILAAFILAIASKKVQAIGANIGIVAGVGLNIYLWLAVPEVFWFWWNAIGCLTTIIVAIVISSFIRNKKSKTIEVVWYKNAKSAVITLLAYFVIIAVLAWSLSKILS